MKKEITYHHLHAIETDIDNIRKQHPALALLLHGTINHFLAKNKIQFDAMYKGLDEVRKKFIETDSMGNLLTEKDATGVEGWKYKTSYTDIATASICMGKSAVKEKLNEKLHEFMQLTITIIL